MNYKKYLKTDTWKEKRRLVIEHSKINHPDAEFGVCELCGFIPNRDGILQVHHKTYENLFNEETDDLIVLCPRCHENETRKQNKRIFIERNEVAIRMEQRNYDFEVVERLAVLSTKRDSTLELRRVSWGHNAPKLEIRHWKHDETGESKPLKGVCLSDFEATMLRNALNKLTF